MQLLAIGQWRRWAQREQRDTEGAGEVPSLLPALQKVKTIDRRRFHISLGRRHGHCTRLGRVPRVACKAAALDVWQADGATPLC